MCVRVYIYIYICIYICIDTSRHIYIYIYGMTRHDAPEDDSTPHGSLRAYNVTKHLSGLCSPQD